MLKFNQFRKEFYNKGDNMNIKLLARIGVISGSLLIGIFVLFLILPFGLNFFIDKYTPQIAGEINKATGLSAGLEDIKIVVSPKLTAGLNVKKFELYTPLKEPIFIADNFEVKMSLLSLLSKNIKVDVVKLNNAEVTLKFNKDGDLDFIKYFPQQENSESEKTEESEFVTENNFSLPFGLKLSNNLPDIHIGGYKIIITDGKDNYTINGGKTDITDFVINKSIKIKGAGKITLKDREQFNYNINLYNKIMPEVELNELVFNPQTEEKQKSEQVKIDIIGILKGLYEYKVTANADIDLKATKDSIDGSVKIGNVSLIDLTPSMADLMFKGNTINIDSALYTAKNEVSTVKGKCITGKKPSVNLNVKSDLDIANVLNIVKKVALIFNINDLKTITANGSLNADFNIKSDLKTVESNGFLKVPNAKLYYGEYNIGIDNIKADISLADNNVNIKNISFSILGQPLKIFGTLTPDAVADIHAIADNLSIKGLLIAVGQASLMKENPIYSGTLSMDAIIKGKLDKINPIIKLNIANLDLKNVPSDLRLKAPSTKLNITSDGVTFGGTAESTNVKLINPVVTASAPLIRANITPEVIEISQTPVTIEKIKTNISGKISNYLTEKIGLDFLTTGDIKSILKGDMNIAKQTLSLVYATTDLSEIIIPMFDKSKLSFRGKINITGNMTNPIISGTVSVPKISIPEVPVTMTDMDLKLNGTILHGSGSVREFTSGGIKAQNLTTDFELKGTDFYLNNLKGTAFSGKVNGNLIYNLSNAKTKLSFKGSGLDAEAAIEGAAGIKNALSGSLGFDTNLTLTVQEYNKMIKSMRGDLAFDIKKGAFGSIGRFEGFLGASNITQNYFLKNTVNALSNAAGFATTAQFDLLDGTITFSDGWAKLNPVRSAGKSLCYYITGNFNLVNATTNVSILGRLDAPMVSKLGPLGTLNMSNIIGDKAATVLKILTSNPQGEKTDLIPALTNGSTNYQDFKVSFNGGVDSKSSIKSFKWLKNADMTDLPPQNIKDVVDSVKDAYKTDINTKKEEINNAIEQKKKEINDAKEQINTTKEDFKNLWKSIKESTKSSKTEETSTDTSSSATTETNSATKTETTKPAETNSSAPKTETKPATTTDSSTNTSKSSSVESSSVKPAENSVTTQPASSAQTETKTEAKTEVKTETQQETKPASEVKSETTTSAETKPAETQTSASTAAPASESAE